MACDAASAATRSAVLTARGVDDEHRVASHPGQQDAFQADLLDLLVGEHADHDDIGLSADVSQVGDRLCTEFTYGSPLFDRSAKRTDLVASLDEAAHHGCAHAARADEPDLGHRCALLFAQALIAGDPWTSRRRRPR